MDVLGVVDGGGETWEKVLWIIGEEGDHEGMNSQLDFVGGQAKGQTGRISHGKRVHELRRKCVKVWGESGSGGGSIGDQEGDGTSLVDLSGDGNGEGAAGIPKDVRCNVREGGSY